MNRSVSVVTFLTIFLAAAVFSSVLSSHSLFWTDEAYSLWRGYRLNLLDYLLGNSDEGNSAPLFFLLSKSVLTLEYFFPDSITNPIWAYRTVAILPSALFLAFVAKDCVSTIKQPLHGFFIVVGLILGVASTTAFVGYSWQARPYGLWLLLSYLFWREGLAVRSTRMKIFTTSTLLALVTPFAFFEIGMRWLWEWGSRVLEGRKDPPAETLYEFARKWAIPTGAGLAIAFYYSLKVPPYIFLWPSPKEILALLFASTKYWIYAVVVGLALLLFQKSRSDSKKIFLFLVLQLLVVITSLAVFYLRRGNGFEMSNRYFLFLLPQSIALLLYCFRLAQPRWEKFHALVLVVSLAWFSIGLQKLTTHMKSITSESSLPSMATNREIIAKRLGNFSKSTCICHDGNYKRPEIGEWGANIFVLREWNRRNLPCTRFSVARFSRMDPNVRARIELIATTDALAPQCELY